MTTSHEPAKTLLLPNEAKLPLNRCNLPPEVLGDLSFQENPKPILIDGVAQLHKTLFQQLDGIILASDRCQLFTRYMSAHFSLEALDEAGYDPAMVVDRSRANYLRVLRGWFFDSDSQEGAVIKSWVESRFGLRPRYHKGSIRTINDKAYARFASQSARGLYNTNGLEAQLDLLYSYCQYELSRQNPGHTSVVLYRGQNRLQSLEQFCGNRLCARPFTIKQLRRENKTSVTLLLNNISSFTSDPERADEFGDVVIRAEVPFAKLVFFSGLLPGIMTSEREFAVIGGVYNVSLSLDAAG